MTTTLEAKLETLQVMQMKSLTDALLFLENYLKNQELPNSGCVLF
jgi:hypothetical protein